MVNSNQMLRNGVSEEGFKELIAQGFAAEVICAVEPEKTANNWNGAWHFRAVAPDGSMERVLVSQRVLDRPRSVRSVVAVVTMLHDLGVRTITIPFTEGGRARNVRPGHNGSTTLDA